MKRATGRMAGFSLLEIMIVLAIAAAAVTLGVTWLNAERARSLRGAAADDTAREIATMARALDTYLATATTLPASGAFDVQHQTLVDAGLLPPGYAMRDVAGTPTLVSPLYQAYSLRAIKVGTKYRGAVFVNAASDPVGGSVPLRKIGLENTEQGTFDFASVAMRRAREKFLITSAVVRKGASATDLPLSGFAADLASLLGAPAARPVLAALVGFTELSANPDIKVSVDPASFGDIGGLNLEGRQCRLTQGSCAEGEEAAWEHLGCSDFNNNQTETSTVSLGADYVTITRNVTYDTANAYPKFPQLLTQPHYIDGSGYIVNEIVFANRADKNISASVNSKGFRSDNLLWTGQMTGQKLSAAREPSWAAPGTTYEVAGVLPGCGSQGEDTTTVYRVVTGYIRYPGMNEINKAYGGGAVQFNSLAPGAVFLSATDPAVSGGPHQSAAYIEQVKFGTGPTTSLLCRVVGLHRGSGAYTVAAAGSYANVDTAITVQSSCPNGGSAVIPSDTEAGDSAPIRKFQFVPSKAVAFKYCCKQ